MLQYIWRAFRQMCEARTLPSLRTPSPLPIPDPSEKMSQTQQLRATAENTTARNPEVHILPSMCREFRIRIVKGSTKASCKPFGGCEVAVAITLRHVETDESCNGCTVDARLTNRPTLARSWSASKTGHMRWTVGRKGLGAERRPMLGTKASLALHFFPTKIEYGESGTAVLWFRMGALPLEDLVLLAVVSSIDGGDAAEPNDQCQYRWPSANGWMDRSEVLRRMCNHVKLYQHVGTIDRLFDTAFTPPGATPPRYNASSTTPPCRGYSHGYWSVENELSLPPRDTTVKDHYRWVEDGCKHRKIGLEDLLSLSPDGVSVFFVGDSLMRNLYLDFYDTIGERMLAVREKSVSFYEVYGYYNEILPENCCGEADCVHRQAVRHAGQAGSGGGMRGLQDAILATATRSLGLMPEPRVLVLNSPVVHHARAYVSTATHMNTVAKVLELVAAAKVEYNVTVIWMGATPYADWKLPDGYMDNRNGR